MADPIRPSAQIRGVEGRLLDLYDLMSTMLTQFDTDMLHLFDANVDNEAQVLAPNAEYVTDWFDMTSYVSVKGTVLSDVTSAASSVWVEWSNDNTIPKTTRPALPTSSYFFATTGTTVYGGFPAATFTFAPLATYARVYYKNGSGGTAHVFGQLRMRRASTALPQGPIGGVLTLFDDAVSTRAVLAGVDVNAGGTTLTNARIRQNRLDAADSFSGMEVLIDQVGAGSVLTFTFSSAVDCVQVHSVGSESRVTDSTQTPSGTFGVRAPDDIPIWLPYQTTTIKVYANLNPATTVTVWGYRY